MFFSCNDPEMKILLAGIAGNRYFKIFNESVLMA
jgi:hypothetical protein